MFIINWNNTKDHYYIDTAIHDRDIEILLADGVQLVVVSVEKFEHFYDDGEKYQDDDYEITLQSP